MVDLVSMGHVFIIESEEELETTTAEGNHLSSPATTKSPFGLSSLQFQEGFSLEAQAQSSEMWKPLTHLYTYSTLRPSSYTFYVPLGMERWVDMMPSFYYYTCKYMN